MNKIFSFFLITGLLSTVLGCNGDQQDQNVQISDETEISNNQKSAGQITQQPTNTNEAKDGKSEVDKVSQESENSKKPYKAKYIDNPQYLDESLYEGDELEIVRLLNKMMKSILTENVDIYRSVLTKDHYQQTDTEQYLKNIKITYLSDATFYEGPSEYFSDMEVGVKEESYLPNSTDSPNAYFGTAIYLMFKEDGQWKIGEKKW
ncbi:hypothetical protein [Paenibacillus solani]|uniref:hypothetical protein n=1 Tax=Paenibacillus solani TaxID=1705565 RepID=UPI003D29FCA9